MQKSYLDRLEESLPRFRDDLRLDNNLSKEEYQRRIDERTDIMSKILAAYPNTNTKKLAAEYGVSVKYIEQIAVSHGVRKSRRDAGVTHAMKVEKVDGQGRVVATYDSVNKAAAAEGVNYHAIIRRANGTTAGPLNGYYWRTKAARPRKRRNSFLDTVLQDDPFDLTGWTDEELY
jgi:hypothetical protein